ncbi:MAG: SGNH/GDSL hydrolase family protein [Chloroflexota bacterium]|nr:SGNH/GDSL hydrolase family protein [Chloroflexota bacterium]
MGLKMKGVVAAVGLVLLGTGGLAIRGLVDRPAPPEQPFAPLYLALGDSLATGVGASDPDETGYVPLVHDDLRRNLECDPKTDSLCPNLRLRNLAKSGATTTTLLRDQVPDALQVLRARNGDGDPGNDVNVISVDIGGNDAFGVYPDCSGGVTPGCIEAVRAMFATVSRNLATALPELREAAGPDTRIIVMTYYNALIGCERSAAAPMADALLEGGAGVPVGLNDLIRERAAQVGAGVAETYGRLSPDDLVGGDDCLHPVDSGYRIIADAFTAPATPAATGGS